jgi:tRNA (cmo5U34)-methyltransferase
MKAPKKPIPTPAPAPDAWIPPSWTFKSPLVAAKFDRHVREQLPWYDQVVEAIAHIGAHYLPEYGLFYDIGASTGTVGRALAPIIRARNVDYFPIEPSAALAAKIPRELLNGRRPIETTIQDAMREVCAFDFAVCNLVLMFLKVADRASVVRDLIARVKPGGAIVFVEKTLAPPGYLGTVMRRMTIRWKLKTTSLEEIVAKELSLAGVQRPINPSIIPVDATRFFQFGEFVGWVWERGEDGRVAYESAATYGEIGPTETMREELTRIAVKELHKQRRIDP